MKAPEYSAVQKLLVPGAFLLTWGCALRFRKALNCAFPENTMRDKRNCFLRVVFLYFAKAFFSYYNIYGSCGQCTKELIKETAVREMKQSGVEWYCGVGSVTVR